MKENINSQMNLQLFYYKNAPLGSQFTVHRVLGFLGLIELHDYFYNYRSRS